MSEPSLSTLSAYAYFSMPRVRACSTSSRRRAYPRIPEGRVVHVGPGTVPLVGGVVPSQTWRGLWIGLSGTGTRLIGKPPISHVDQQPDRVRDRSEARLSL